MNTDKAAILAQIYNADGSISRRKIRKLLFPNILSRHLRKNVEDVAFNMPQEEWDRVIYALLPDARELGQYHGWEYDRDATAEQHIENFVTYVLKRMGVDDPALTKSTST